MRKQFTCPRCQTFVETEIDKDGMALCPRCENFTYFPTAVVSQNPIPKWISAKDELPDEAREVLVYLTSEWLPKITVAALIDFGHGLQWITVGGNYYHGAEFSRITHWMPLPEPPESEGQQ